MFISKDLNKKCYVITGIPGVFMLDNILYKVKQTIEKDGFINLGDLYYIVNSAFNCCDFDDLRQYFWTDTKDWRYDYCGHSLDHAIFTLYIPYERQVEKTKSINGTPDISSIETYNDRVVLIRFKDGTFTKAVAMDKDPFDFDMLFTIAYMKRMLGEDGHKKYHKLIDNAHKIVKKQEKNEEEKLRKQAEQKERLEKLTRKKERKESKKNDQLGRLIFGAVVDAFEYNSMQNTNNTEDDLK